MKRKPIFNDLNPKAVTNDELFGIINPATREWKDGNKNNDVGYDKYVLIYALATLHLEFTGLFSVLMRDQANLTTDNPKWIVLDGDIDPMWIESLNTVMDDNKVSLIASNIEKVKLNFTLDGKK